MKTNTELFEELNRLRSTRPVLWAVLRGAITTPAICKSIMWPPRRVLAAIDQTPEIYMDGATWKVRPEYEHLLELQAFSKKLFKSIVEYEKQHRGTPEGKGTDLAEGQQLIWDQVRAQYGTEQEFTVLQAALAAGYKKAGFMGNVLRALERKGWAKKVADSRPMRWQLIDNR